MSEALLVACCRRRHFSRRWSGLSLGSLILLLGNLVHDACHLKELWLCEFAQDSLKLGALD